MTSRGWRKVSSCRSTRRGRTLEWTPSLRPAMAFAPWIQREALA
jgi:hypothetical protein